eukprot:CAMPEP_0168443796 /NCGR_PEP_ID=MMETSP0228-20121227/44715_1 /TAXON_ID=133427 /ORGANISM="Protoceratium reticulatum, Strain CCCM 535 (=CCMP 1889)" /LENGTH=92 /DNA_ID=CAMNT_0008458213 /DNA_START=46 /DNA_END=320 /DNA_ORIENTATION=+
MVFSCARSSLCILVLLGTTGAVANEQCDSQAETSVGSALMQRERRQKKVYKALAEDSAGPEPEPEPESEPEPYSAGRSAAADAQFLMRASFG